MLLEIHTREQAVERSIPAFNRNALCRFLSEHRATIASLIETCRLNNFAPRGLRFRFHRALYASTACARKMLALNSPISAVANSNME